MQQSSLRLRWRGSQISVRKFGRRVGARVAFNTEGRFSSNHIDIDSPPILRAGGAKRTQ